MPQKCQPTRLELLAQRAVGEWVKMVGQGLMDPVHLVTQRDSNCGQLFLQHSLDYIRETLYATLPRYVFDEMAVEVLTSISQLINETKYGYDNDIPMAAFLNKMKVAVHLTEVVMHPQLKKIAVWDWPKIMRHVLNQNLSKLVGLETLDLGSGSFGMDTTETEKYILSGVQWMSNLTSFSLCFDCTNTIISVISRSCPHLQRLDVTSSKSVTDRSVPFLLNCKKLLKVQLYRTSVSAAGYTKLLSELPSIQDFGRCEKFGKVLQMLQENNSDPLPTKSCQCVDLTEEQLRLLVKYFPRLTGFSILHVERVADLTILGELTDLKDLKLLNCDFFGDFVKELLDKRGFNLHTLLLEHVDEIDLNALIFISQYCPNLKSLSFYNCEFVEHALLTFNLNKLAVRPFSVLEKLKCVSDCSLVHLEFLMIYCKNIKFIQLGSSTGVNDETMSRVLGQNPMRSIEELRILYSHNLSMQTVELLMTHCDSLHTLSELESWEGITSSELSDFREHLRRNNIKLDTRPTLSY